MTGHEVTRVPGWIGAVMRCSVSGNMLISASRDPTISPPGRRTSHADVSLARMCGLSAKPLASKACADVSPVQNCGHAKVAVARHQTVSMPTSSVTRLSVVAMVGLSLVLAPRLSGQSPSCVVPPSDRLVPGGIEATLWPLDSDAPDIRYTARMLETIQDAYRTTTPMTLGEYSVLDSLATEAAFTPVDFTRTPAASVENVRVVSSSLSPAFDRAAFDAVNAAGASG